MSRDFLGVRKNKIFFRIKKLCLRNCCNQLPPNSIVRRFLGGSKKWNCWGWKRSIFWIAVFIYHQTVPFDTFSGHQKDKFSGYQKSSIIVIVEFCDHRTVSNNRLLWGQKQHIVEDEKGVILELLWIAITKQYHITYFLGVENINFLGSKMW